MYVCISADCEGTPSNVHEKESLHLRETGNLLYKAGKFADAIASYTEAAIEAGKAGMEFTKYCLKFLPYLQFNKYVQFCHCLQHMFSIFFLYSMIIFFTDMFINSTSMFCQVPLFSFIELHSYNN
jgi:hypothetical protein